MLVMYCSPMIPKRLREVNASLIEFCEKRKKIVEVEFTRAFILPLFHRHDFFDDLSGALILVVAHSIVFFVIQGTVRSYVFV